MIRSEDGTVSIEGSGKEIIDDLTMILKAAETVLGIESVFYAINNLRNCKVDKTIDRNKEDTILKDAVEKAKISIINNFFGGQNDKKD